jgi:hypothetical protein
LEYGAERHKNDGRLCRFFKTDPWLIHQ